MSTQQCVYHSVDPEGLLSDSNLVDLKPTKQKLFNPLKEFLVKNYLNFI